MGHFNIYGFISSLFILGVIVLFIWTGFRLYKKNKK